MLTRFPFRGGVALPLLVQDVQALAVEELPPAPRLHVPVWQSLNALPEIVVKHGEQVVAGQVIAVASQGGSDLHAPLSGTVHSIMSWPHPWGGVSPAIEIEPRVHELSFSADSGDTRWRDAAPGELIRTLASLGLVVMQGTGTGVQQALSVSAERSIDALLINAVECDGTMQLFAHFAAERAEQILQGIILAKKIVNASQVLLVCPRGWKNKPPALVTMLADSRFAEIKAVYCKPFYPLSNPRILLFAALRREIPSTQLPAEAGCVVLDIVTVLAFWEAVSGAVPLTRRLVLVHGPALAAPRLVRVPVGTPIGYILNACGVGDGVAKKVVVGGVLGGHAIADVNAPVIKATGTVYVTNQPVSVVQSHACINCGRCLAICPIGLAPMRLYQYAAPRNLADSQKWGISECIECGCCAYVCPSRINIVHHIKLSKFNLAQRLKKSSGDVRV